MSENNMFGWNGTKYLLTALVLTGVILMRVDCFADTQAESGSVLRVTLLGTGVPVPNPRQMGPSILVEAGETKLLFDCGRGCAHRLWNIDHDYLRDTHHLFITHLHSDHTSGLVDLYINGWVLGRTEPMQLFGPKNTDELMRHLRLAYEQDIHYRIDKQISELSRDSLEYSVTETVDGAIYEIGEVKVTAFEVDHHVIKPAFGYRVDYAGRSVVISGDTAYSTNLIENSKGVDVLIHEVMSPPLEGFLRKTYPKDVAEDIIALHTLAPDVGRVFSGAKPRLGVFTHFNNDPKSIPELIEQTRTTWDGPLAVGEDLMVIEIGDQVSVHAPDSRDPN